MKTKVRFYLSILLITAVFFPTRFALAAPLSNTDSLRLHANAGWVDSSFVLQASQQITITAHGQAITAPINVFGSGSVSGPNGQWNICPNYDSAPPCAMDNAPYGALVGKIGANGTPFLIGSNDTFTAGSSGELYLAVNDLLLYYADNYGNYMVFFNH
jgi:glucose dehydrogenase